VVSAPAVAPYLFANDRDEDFSPVGRATMFEQENALPGSELHLTVDDRNGLAGARQDHADMRRHVVAAFGAMCKVIGILRDQTVEEFFQITSRSRIGIFHDDHAATGMLDKHRRRPVPDAASIDLGLHFARDFVQSLSVRAGLKLIVMNVH
jgi:hypothetical protein